MQIEIQPVQVMGSQVGTQVDFGKFVVVPAQSASCLYTVKDSTGNALYNGTVEMTPEQYAAWGTDDNYAADCFLLNLGLQRA